MTFIPQVRKKNDDDNSKGSDFGIGLGKAKKKWVEVAKRKQSSSRL